MRKVVDFTKISKEYGQCYVARLKGTNKIVAHAKTVNKLVDKIKDKKEFNQDKVVISWVPKYGARYLFRISLRLYRS